MKRYFYKLLLLLSCALVASCQDDPTDDPSYNVADGYGSDLTFHVEADLSQDMPIGCVLPEGRVSIYMSLADGSDGVFYADHLITDDCSEFTFDEPLPQGEHITHMISIGDEMTRTTTDMLDDLHVSTIPFGTTLQVGATETQLTNTTYSKLYSCSGDGTEDSPYEISSALSLAAVAIYMDENKDFVIGGAVHFEQTADLDFSLFSDNTGHSFDGLCKDGTRPFQGWYDGRNKSINYLQVSRFAREEDGTYTQQSDSNSSVDAAGLFCHVAQANIKRVRICKPTIVGYYYVGALVGAVRQISGVDQACTNISECYLISDSSLNTVTNIFGYSNVGGLIGGVDDNASLMMKDCGNQIDSSFSASGYKDAITCYDSSVSGGFCGGIVGGSYINSFINLTGCSNSMDITSDGAVAIGGLVGGCYNLSLSDCSNSGAITASNALGVGGLAGGAIDSYVVSCENTGAVSGDNGVGGIIGSAVQNIDNNEYGNANCCSLHNTGTVTANKYAGGMVGSAQVRFTNTYNEGKVVSNDESAGGLVGYAPVASTLNCNNLGEIEAQDAAGGIAGMAYMFNFAATNNLGQITGDDDSGGIVGRSGCYGSINFCNNYGSIYGNGEVGGIAGTLGKSAEWEFDWIALFSIGLSALCVVADIGVEHSGLDKGLEKFISVIIKIVDAGKTIAAWTLEGLELDEGYGEAEEFGEPLEYHDFDEEEFKANLIKQDSLLQIDMDKAVRASTNLKYSGDMSLISGFDPATLCYENALAFNTYLNSEDETSDSNDELTEDDTTNPYYKYNTEVYERLGEKAEQEIKRYEAKEIGIYLEKAICNIICFVVDCFTGGVGGGVFNAVNELVMEIIQEATEKDFNAIYVEQVAGFGYSQGSGIVGEVGDQVQLNNILSAGKVGKGGIAGNSMGGAHYLIVGEQELDIWDGGTDVSHSTIIWQDKNTSTNRYSQDQIATSDPYKDNCFFISQFLSGTPGYLWSLDEGSYSFALPDDNYYYLKTLITEAAE